MVLCYGEILADMIGTPGMSGTVCYERYAGGAPFNVACACKRAGGQSGFVGSVGDDLIGAFLRDFAAAQGLTYTDIRVLPERNTTLAFVQLDGSGERSFCFYRHGTADYRLDTRALEAVERADIVHLGSLMLSEPEGVAFADALAERVQRAGKKLSFDINYRDDIFPDPQAAKKAYAAYADAADIVKYSLEELELFTGMKGLGGLKKVSRPRKLVCVTMGGEGSAFCLGDRMGIVPSVKVQAVDTTGAGDAFYGALLAKLDGKDLSQLSHEALVSAFSFANAAGALATTARGAINSLPNKEEIENKIENK